MFKKWDLKRYITQVGKQGGGASVNVIFEEKNFKIGFLSDHTVPATPKYIYG